MGAAALLRWRHPERGLFYPALFIAIAEQTALIIKMWGTRFAIDDFGTGYSNIAYLQKLNVDQLKLDQLFIKRIEHTDNLNHIMDGLIDLGNRVGLTLAH